MEDVTDDILTEKILRDMTRAQAELLHQIFIPIPGLSTGDTISFQHHKLVEYLITDKVKLIHFLLFLVRSGTIDVIT